MKRVMICKVLTVWEPWASLLVTGVKQYETRGWDMRHRGLLLIHAARLQTDIGLQLWHDLRLYKRPEFSGLKFDQLPFGKIVGSVKVAESRPTEELLDDGLIGAAEREIGDFAPDRYGILCMEPRRLENPIPARGRQKIWEIECASEMELVEQLKLAPRFGVVDTDRVLDEISGVHV